MIPSENHTSPAVLEALGTILADKYSEGYPGRRYYAGNQFIDQIENLAIARAKKFSAYLMPENKEEIDQYLKNFRKEIAENKAIKGIKQKGLEFIRQFPIPGIS